MPTHAPGTVGDSVGEGMVDSAVEVLGTIISSRTTGLGMSTTFYPHFHGGIVFDVSPLWIAPAPYIGVTPAPPPPPAPVWYYCTDPPGYYPIVPECTVPWSPGSAFWIAA